MGFFVYGTGVATLGSVNVSLFQSAAALNATSRWQEAISENLASASIPGFKKQDISFDAVQSGVEALAKSQNKVGLPNASAQTNFSQGEMKFTGVNTDVGIDGKGFFEIQMPNGSLGYTRDGEFQINAQGQLVTKTGNMVVTQGGAFTIDRNDPSPVVISATGDISQGGVRKGKLKIVEFNDPHLLTQTGGGVFIANNPNLVSTTVAQPSLRDGFLEAANTSPVSEMANLISAMRSFETTQKTIQMNDDRMGKVISDLGNPTS